MSAVIDISAVMCVGLIASILFKPGIMIKKHNVGTYWVVALSGAIVLVIFGCISLNDIWNGLTASSTINPIKILVLFLSMTIQSVFLDELGMFRYCANLALKHAKGSQKSLFILLFCVVAVLTVFTSNDIIILTFTPFICYFSKNAKINPIPYLFTEFVAANTWSMALIIGNPTNVYLASSAGINFVEYVKVMWFPTIVGGVTALAVLYLIFRRELKKPMQPSEDDFAIKDKGLLIIGVAHLSLCTLLLVASSYIGIEMWFVTMCFAISLFIISGIYIAATKKNAFIIPDTLARMPFDLIPFVISMFVFVLAFDKVGLSAKIGNYLDGGNVILKYGTTSFITANLVNNIPMSVLFSSIAKTLESGMLLDGVFAAVIGSNIGAFFTPIGALAGIMWTGILKKHNVTFNFLTYVKYGVVISIPTLIATLLGLMAIM